MKIAAISVLLLFLSASVATATEVDGIAAKVGSKVILKSEILSEMRRAGLGSSMTYEEVRNEMIDHILILKAAKEAKMTMQEWVVDNRIREIVNRAFDGDRNRLMDQLAKERLSYPEWRQKMVDDMVISAMRWQMIDKNVTASPEEMKREYADHPELYSKGLKVTVSVILLKPEDAEKRDEVSQALKEMDFADVARKYSAGPKAAEGGVWKDVEPEKSFRPEVSEEIVKMPVGTISNWIELDGWSFLVRKDASTEAEKMTFAEAFDQIEENVRSAKARDLYAAWVDRMRAETYIKIY